MPEKWSQKPGPIDQTHDGFNVDKCQENSCSILLAAAAHSLSFSICGFNPLHHALVFLPSNQNIITQPIPQNSCPSKTFCCGCTHKKNPKSLFYPLSEQFEIWFWKPAMGERVNKARKSLISAFLVFLDTAWIMYKSNGYVYCILLGSRNWKKKLFWIRILKIHSWLWLKRLSIYLSLKNIAFIQRFFFNNKVF